MGYSCYRDSCPSDLSRVPYVSWVWLQPFWTWMDKQLVDRRSPSWGTKYAVCPSFLEQHRNLRISLYLSKLIHLYCKSPIALAIFINNRSPSEPTKSTCGYWVLLAVSSSSLRLSEELEEKNLINQHPIIKPNSWRWYQFVRVMLFTHYSAYMHCVFIRQTLNSILTKHLSLPSS